MQKGMMLHLAILRKIANLSPKPTRTGVSSIPKRSEVETKAQFDANLPAGGGHWHRRHKNTPRTAPQKQDRIDNLTISAWSIDGNENNEEVDKVNQPTIPKPKEKRYRASQPGKVKQHHERRNFSLVGPKNLGMDYDRVLEQRMNNLGLSVRELREKKASVQPQKQFFKPVKRISIGFEKENIVEAAAPKWSGKKPPVNKLPSFEAFVSEVRQVERHRRRLS